MLRSVRDLVSRHLGGDAQPGSDHAHGLRLATAALLVEMARADTQASAGERAHILELVAGHFALPAAEAEALLAAADARADHAVSLHEFTRDLNARLTPADKARVIELLWRVAFADAELHRHEDHLVRKVADLLYVPHAEFIRLKLAVQGSLAAG